MYGETGWSRRGGCARAGLSPHVRGNPSVDDRRREAMRSIPACTGKPGPQAGGTLRARVYPRMYGETMMAG